MDINGLLGTRAGQQDTETHRQDDRNANFQKKRFKEIVINKEPLVISIRSA